VLHLVSSAESVLKINEKDWDIVL